MKQITELSLATLASSMSQILSDELGGDFDVCVQKLERVDAGAYSTKLLINFVVNDESAIERSFLRSRHGWFDEVAPNSPILTVEQFRKAAKRTETDSEVIYDVRTLQAEQMPGLTRFLADLSSKAQAKTLSASKPIVFITDDGSPPEQVDEYVRTLGGVGLLVTFQKAADDIRAE